MKSISLTVNKAMVYDEVAKTTSYAGAKMKDDANAYDRIFTTDADRLMLERFWVEASSVATGVFKQFLVSVNEQRDIHCVELERNYEVELELSNSFDVNLSGSMETSLFSFFVSSILASWFKFTNPADAASFAADAVSAMQDVKSKLFFRTRPKRKRIET